MPRAGLDAAIGTLPLPTVAPAAVDVAPAVQQDIASSRPAAMRVVAQLQRCRYEAELARRRYVNVRFAQRLATDALEVERNERLRQGDASARPRASAAG